MKLPANISIDLDAVKAEMCRRSFFYFLTEFWDVVIPDQFIYNWHIEYLCEELQKVQYRVKKRLPKEYDLIINIPPGTSKSTICTIMYPVWCWTTDPSQRFITASYSNSLSIDHAVKSRDILRSERYIKYFGELIKKDNDNKTHYENIHNGARIVTSVGGSAIGRHAHQIIVDDPINPQEAQSEVIRKSANDYMDRSLSTRKIDKEMTPTILVMQRLAQEDPTGNWLSKEGKAIKHICLPGLLDDGVKPVELREKYTNGLLDSVRMNEDAINQMRIDLGSYGFAGQIQQRPAPEGGEIWQKWLIEIDDDVFPPLSSMINVGTDWDLAYTDKEINSASAHVTSGKIGKDMYIDSFGYIYKEFPDLIKFMALKISPHYIEAKASGKSAKQTLKHMGINAVEVTLKGGDKVARTRNATPRAEAGFVYIRKSIAQKLYYDDKQGIINFPNSPADDLNDALVQAIQRHFKGNEFFSL